MCLMLKFLYYSKIQLNQDNWNWIISISTIIGYKIYYDDTILGLMESFSKILNIDK